MKILLLALSCLVCGVALGFVLNTLLIFGDFRWPGQLSKPTLIDNERASLSTSPPGNPIFPKIDDSVRLQPEKAANSEFATQSSSTAESNLGQQTNSETNVFSELSYEQLAEFSPESSISDQQQLLALIADADLAQIMQAYNEIPDDNNRIYDQQWVISLLAQRRVELDPQGVLLEIENSLLNPQSRYDGNLAMYSLAKNYARQFPQDMMNWLGNLPENSANPDLLMSMYLSLAEVAPESAIEMIMQNPSMATSVSGGPENILYEWAEQDPTAALKWLQSQDDERFVNQHAESIISMLIYRDPDAARAAAREFPGLVPESMFVLHEAGTLAESDPRAAFAMAESITDKEQSMSAKQTVLYTWSMDDPIAAIEFINTLPEGNERVMYASMVVGSIGAGPVRSIQKRDELLAWSETLSPDLKMQVLQPLIMQWADQEPQAAIDWWNSQPDSAEKSSLLESIAWNIPVQQAMDLYPVANESTQVALSSTIIRHLYASEPAAAQNWYEQLPNNAVKQQSLSELFMMTAEDNPQQALFLLDDALASSASGSGARVVELVFGLLPMVAYQHGDLAENWLQGADLEDEVKAQLRDMITGVRSQLNSFPMPVPYDMYPPVMPDGSLYRMQFMND